MIRGVLAAASAIAVVLAGGGCGGHTQRRVLEWTRAPQVFTLRDLPRDRIVIGRIRNASTRTLRLTAAELHVRDAQDHSLESSGGFTASYAHGLFGAFQKPAAVPLRELVRLGRIVILDPGATSPLFAAWRLPLSAHEPLTLDYGYGSLAIPTATRPTAP